VVKGHRLRSTKLWTHRLGGWEGETGYDSAMPPMYRCEVLRIKSLEALRLWIDRRDLNPSVCRECAVRLGLEW